MSGIRRSNTSRRMCRSLTPEPLRHPVNVHQLLCHEPIVRDDSHVDSHESSHVAENSQDSMRALQYPGRRRSCATARTRTASSRAMYGRLYGNRATGTRRTSRSPGTDGTGEPDRGHSATRVSAESMAAMNASPSPGSCSSYHVAAASSSATASAEKRTGRLTERGRHAVDRAPAATTRPCPHRTELAEHAARAPVPTPRQLSPHRRQQDLRGSQGAPLRPRHAPELAGRAHRGESLRARSTSCSA